MISNSFEQKNKNLKCIRFAFWASQVVYLSETAGYIPVTSLRNRPGSNAGYHLEPELDGWRQEPWDREYSHRFRFNNTRVQRK